MSWLLTSDLESPPKRHISLPRNATRLKLHALHAGLPMDEQLAAFEPAERGFRKVIVSTNIAEASFSSNNLLLYLTALLGKCYN